MSTTTILAFAGEQTGTVRMDHGQYSAGPESAGLTFFYVQGAAKYNTPACNTYSDRWVINNSWPAAKIQTAILLSAITSGKTVTVRGQGECSQWPNSETAIDIRLNN
jgi:hypothetical protein